jgi:hypothetical protein
VTTRRTTPSTEEAACRGPRQTAHPRVHTNTVHDTVSRHPRFKFCQVLIPTGPGDRGHCQASASRCQGQLVKHPLPRRPCVLAFETCQAVSRLHRRLALRCSICVMQEQKAVLPFLSIAKCCILRGDCFMYRKPRPAVGLPPTSCSWCVLAGAFRCTAASAAASTEHVSTMCTCSPGLEPTGWQQDSTVTDLWLAVTQAPQSRLPWLAGLHCQAYNPTVGSLTPGNGTQRSVDHCCTALCSCLHCNSSGWCTT